MSSTLKRKKGSNILELQEQAGKRERERVHHAIHTWINSFAIRGGLQHALVKDSIADD